MDKKHLHDLEAGMRLIANYAQRIARERHKETIEAKWSYRGTLSDGPTLFILTLTRGGRSQDVSFQREAIENYPDAVSAAHTEAFVEECLRRLNAPASRE
jgi:hypothetical protein